MSQHERSAGDERQEGRVDRQGPPGGERPLDHEQHETLDKAGAPIGAASGALAAGAAGTLILGPIGTAIGAIGGAIGGWWAGSAMASSVPYTDSDEEYYRGHFERAPRTGRDYRNASLGYRLGHIAARNPDYRGRTFEDVEPELRHGWNDAIRGEHGDWESIRDYAKHAFQRGRHGAIGTSPHIADMGGTPSHERAAYNDPGPPQASPERGFPDRPVGAAEPSTGVQETADRSLPLEHDRSTPDDAKKGWHKGPADPENRPGA